PTFIFSAKGSYLDQTSKALYAYAGPQGLPFSFLDVYGKATFKANSGSKLSMFGFNMTDKANFRGIAEVDWVSTGAGTQFVLIPEGAGNTISGNLGYSNFESGQREADGRPRRSAITGFNGTVSVTQ
ncbi:MAG: TonB-dependent receptor, partial [Bacteroidota bacterium]